jgi:hypothetical protein
VSARGWIRCPLGCGISHREGDENPVHDAQWASDVLRDVVRQAEARGVIVVFSKPGELALGDTLAVLN